MRAPFSAARFRPTCRSGIWSRVAGSGAGCARTNRFTAWQRRAERPEGRCGAGAQPQDGRTPVAPRTRGAAVFETHELFARSYQEEHKRLSLRKHHKLAALAQREEMVYRGARGLIALTPLLIDDIRQAYGIDTPGSGGAGWRGLGTGAGAHFSGATHNAVVALSRQPAPVEGRGYVDPCAAARETAGRGCTSSVAMNSVLPSCGNWQRSCMSCRAWFSMAL